MFDSKPLGDHEFPDPDDEDQDDAIACPSCGASVYDDLDQCPVCWTDLSQTTSPWSGRPTWWIVLGFIGILMTILALAGV